MHEMEPQNPVRIDQEGPGSPDRQFCRAAVEALKPLQWVSGDCKMHRSDGIQSLPMQSPHFGWDQKQYRSELSQLLSLAIPETALAFFKSRNKAEDEPAPPKLFRYEVGHPPGQNRRKSKRQCFLPYATYGLFHFVRLAL